MEYVKLSECADFSELRTKHITIENYITTENMLPNKAGVALVSSLPAVNSASKYEPNDILLSNIRPYFKKIWLADKTGSCSNDVLVIKSKKEYYPPFLYYVLSDNNFFNYATVTSKGTKMPRGTPRAIMKYLVPVYPYSTQQKIANILSAYDDLIENNNRRIRILEQMAENLYKEWFVRFRFPGHETTEFENGLPKGWEIKRIGNIAEIKSGYAFKSEWWTESGLPVIKIKDIKNNTIDTNDLSRISKKHSLLAKQYWVSAGDLLIAMTGATIGKLAIVPFFQEQLVVNQRVGKFFLGNNPVATVPFVYYTLQQNWIQELIVMIAGSNAAQPNISSFDIEKIKIVYNEKTVDFFNKKVAKIIKKILLLQRKNSTLIKQRDMLLPRLMSGKLEV